MPDTTLPRLIGLDLPETIDLSLGGAAVQLSAAAIAASGIRNVILWFNRDLSLSGDTLPRIDLEGHADSWSDGRSGVTLEILPHNAPGTITVERVEVEDLAGNVAIYNTADLIRLGLDTSMTIQGSVADITPPQLVSIDLPDVIDLSNSITSFDVDVTATDNRGIRDVVVWLDREVVQSYGGLTVNETAMFRLGGYGDSWEDGRSVESVTLTDATPAGLYDVTRITVEDLYGNVTTYANDDLRRLGLDRQMTVTGSDPVPPQTAYAQLSIPDVLVLREGSAATINLGFMGMTRNYTDWSVHTSTAGGTATGADIGALSAQGHVSVYSTSPTSRSTSFTVSATRDDIQEATETAYLTVALDGNVRFEDGGRMKVIEVRILDDNLTTGGPGANVLRGTSGADTLRGGAGNDSYHVTPGDLVVELANEGVDTIHNALSSWLPANVENLVLTGAAAINGTGNGLNNRLAGNAAANVLNGAAGADTLAGGAGNDTYITDGGDTIAEAANGGIDTVRSSATHTLSANVENLALTGAAAINGTGNALNNLIRGNAGANVLNGGTGADTLEGGAGNDTYVTDGGDTIREAAGGGTDMVRSSATVGLSVHVENLTLTGTAAINGTGNALNNWITGNAGANVLNGGLGADTLVGGAGNDIYVTDGGDMIREAAGGGTDTVRSTATHALSANVENLTLTGTGAINGTGNALNNSLTGNAAANVLNGWTGDDLLYGGAGNDTLMGGAGADRLVGGAGRDILRGGAGDGATDVFVFNHVSDSTVGAGRDVVAEFVSGIDDIDLRGMDANQRLAGDQAFTFSGTGARANAVWFAAVEGGIVLRGDVTGDRTQDFEIMLSGIARIGAVDLML